MNLVVCFAGKKWVIDPYTCAEVYKLESTNLSPLSVRYGIKLQPNSEWKFIMI
jgi:hypothetical protein